MTKKLGRELLLLEMHRSAIQLHLKLPAGSETLSVQIIGAMSHPGDTQVAAVAIPEGPQPVAVPQTAQGVANPPVASAAQTSLPAPQNSIKNQLLGASQQQPLNGSYLTPSAAYAQPGLQVLLTFCNSVIQCCLSCIFSGSMTTDDRQPAGALLKRNLSRLRTHTNDPYIQ